MIQRLDPVKLTARRAFVAYNGVISIIYDGWPPQVETLQDTIERRLGEMHEEDRFKETQLLLKASSGSLFPKTSLGALCDECTLTHEEYTQIDDICIRWGAGFELLLDALSLSTYVDRQQLHIVHDRELVLREDLAAIGFEATLAKDQKNRTRKVLAETKLPNYLEKVNEPGHRASHYKERVRTSSYIRCRTAAAVHPLLYFRCCTPYIYIYI